MPVWAGQAKKHYLGKQCCKHGAEEKPALPGVEVDSTKHAHTDMHCKLVPQPPKADAGVVASNLFQQKVCGQLSLGTHCSHLPWAVQMARLAPGTASAAVSALAEAEASAVAAQLAGAAAG